MTCFCLAFHLSVSLILLYTVTFHKILRAETTEPIKQHQQQHSETWLLLAHRGFPKEAQSFPTNSPPGECSWFEEKFIDEERYCRLPKREYGLLLFELGLADRNLRVANYWLSNERQRQRDQERYEATETTI